MTQAQQHLAVREYWASANGAGLQAPNRAHNLRTYFEKSGIRVHDRTAGGSPQLLRLSLAGVGREEPLAGLAPGEGMVSDQSRVEIHRPGLVEWYVNSEAGLEQGFTLSERPPGDGPLILELALAGARASLRGDAVVFATREQRTLRYGELVAIDAAQQPLAAHLEVSNGDRLRIVVETARGGGSARNRWRRTSGSPSPASRSRSRAGSRCSRRWRVAGRSFSDGGLRPSA